MEMDVNFMTEDGVKTQKTFTAQHTGGGKHGKRNKISSWWTRQTSCRNSYKLKQASISIAASAIGEFVGTLVLVLVIISMVSSSILSLAQVGLWQVAIVCGVGVSLSIFCTSYVCDAHLNPAITVAFAIIRPKTFSWKKILLYITSQMLGGVAAGAILYFFAYEQISIYERNNQIVRGSNSSVITAMMFGEYYPNPALFSHDNPDSYVIVSTFKAFAVETWSTSILAFVIFSCTNKANSAVGPEENRVVVPILIGLTVALLISMYAPYTQIGINPSRDFGPRLVAYFAGWGAVAIPGPRKGFWVYILGPVVGAVGGAALSDLVFYRLAKAIKKFKK